MAERADELYLPNAVLLRIIKDSLPERTIVNREARSAISKAVSSFILYVTSLASAHCSNAKRKTLTADDIFAALKEMQFGHYLPNLTTFLQNCRLKASRKKQESQTHAPGTGATTSTTDFDISIETHTKIGSSSTSTTSFSVPNLVDIDEKMEFTEELVEEQENDDIQRLDEGDNDELLPETVEENSTTSKTELIESLDSKI